MKIQVHEVDGKQIAEIISDGIVIASAEDGIDLVGNLSYSGYEHAIVHARNLTPEFFDLSTRLAGEVLQKFTTYRVRLAIVGDFTNVESKSLRDFIYESNKSTQVNFVASVDEAIRRVKGAS
jgi:hypothetical protein